MNKITLVFSALYGILAVMLGAFGAHGLAHTLPAEALSQSLANWNTAAEYQMHHALALLAIAALQQVKPQWAQSSLINAASIAWCIGVPLFSGSLYLYVLSGVSAIAMITPIGGLLLMLGWLCLLIGFVRA